jgi:hypothetical protein
MIFFIVGGEAKMNETPEEDKTSKESTSQMTFLNTQILNFQKKELSRYAKILGKSRGWVVREALHRFFVECREDGLQDEEEK